MRRTVGQSPDSRPRRSFQVAAASLTTVLLIGARGFAGDDEPELTRPAEMPAVAKPATPPATPSAPVNNSTGARAVLALPGLTTPSARPSPTVITSSPTLDPIPGELSLDAPIEMRGQPTPSMTNPAIKPGRTSRPIVLESTPDGEPGPIGGPLNGTRPDMKRSTTSRIDPQSVPAPARRGRLFGLLPGNAPSPAPTTSSATRSPQAGRAVADDLQEDAANESALKRRIERQAREAVGDRARSIDVRVVGKNATVQAHGVRFYQKRAVRKSLEAIPSISGLRTTIEVND